MPDSRVRELLRAELAELKRSGRLKAREKVIAGVIPPSDGKGPRYLLQGEGNKPFLRMNSNSYLGLSLTSTVMQAEEAAVGRLGVGPGAVRFISGTWHSHVALEEELARFHRREAGMIFSSAYATVMGVLPPLITEETAVISDELNHNSIINALRLARPKEKLVYKHLDLDQLESRIAALAGKCRRGIVITDGVFSMRGDFAPLREMSLLIERYNDRFPEDLLLVVDDSHGVGAFGVTGRGTEEQSNSPPADLLIGTLGKAFGVNGGYVVGKTEFIDYLRQTSPFYIYSNPIGPAEAAAALAAVKLVAGDEGPGLLARLRGLREKFAMGLERLGLETIPGVHPIVPLMLRDTEKTARTVDSLHRSGVLATGLTFPVVPSGDEEIRFQISADHTSADIDEAVDALQKCV